MSRKIDLSDPTKIIIIDIKNISSKQKKMIREYANYNKWYAFSCNYDSFPIRERTYVCNRCDKVFYDCDFGGYECYIKCWCNVNYPSFYCYGTDNDPPTGFDVRNKYNALVLTANVVINNFKQKQIDINILITLINKFDIDVYYETFFNIRDKLSGTDKTDQDLIYIGNIIKQTCQNNRGEK